MRNGGLSFEYVDYLHLSIDGSLTGFTNNYIINTNKQIKYYCQVEVNNVITLIEFYEKEIAILHSMEPSLRFNYNNKSELEVQ